jgi:hypothetical protein
MEIAKTNVLIASGVHAGRAAKMDDPSLEGYAVVTNELGLRGLRLGDVRYVGDWDSRDPLELLSICNYVALLRARSGDS